MLPYFNNFIATSTDYSCAVTTPINSEDLICMAGQVFLQLTLNGIPNLTITMTRMSSYNVAKYAQSQLHALLIMWRNICSLSPAELGTFLINHTTLEKCSPKNTSKYSYYH